MIKLGSGSTITTISETGAWVETLTIHDKLVFFPKTLLRSELGEEKIRGGMHVCLPNFGPDSANTLPQHGFGRTEVWNETRDAGSHATLELHGGTVHYAQLVATLDYRLHGSSLVSTLQLVNNGARPLRVAPAFHPYFALDDSETAVRINGDIYELSSLSGTEFIEAETVELETANYTLQLSQTNLSTWSIWTDQLGPYICVEPTFGGNRFLETEQSDELLNPKASRQYSLTISW
ncbi:MAG TPA: aldose epimerase [Candidatus Saccharibacteria bacterium]|nr:aldose epimerase [Candidatus Saccharibacteria bacterium]